MKIAWVFLCWLIVAMVIGILFGCLKKGFFSSDGSPRCGRCASRHHTDCEDAEFMHWNGSYQKQFYDVKLRDGSIVKQCWPNAGVMHATDSSGRKFFPVEVDGIRVSCEQNFPET